MKTPRETLDELKRAYEERKRRLQAAYEAAVSRGGVILVTDADRERFEQACVPRPLHHPTAADGAVRNGVRC
jgi:hypothetical protein